MKVRRQFVFFFKRLKNVAWASNMISTLVISHYSLYIFMKSTNGGMAHRHLLRMKCAKKALAQDRMWTNSEEDTRGYQHQAFFCCTRPTERKVD